MGDLNLKGGRGIVIGAGGEGMGGATTSALAGAGARIAGIDISAEAIAPLADRFGEQFRPFSADVTDPEQLEAVFEQAADDLGGLDFLVNVAGGTRPGDWARTDQQDLDRVYAAIDLNLFYVFRSCRLAGQRMMKTGGAIVNFSSVDAITSAPYHSPYGMAKAGIESLTQSLAVEWAEFGIRVNAVAPGSIRTPKILAQQPTQFDVSAEEPVYRSLEPSEVGDVVLFLISSLGRGVNGQILPVDGGMTARAASGTLSAFAAMRVPDEFATGAKTQSNEEG